MAVESKDSPEVMEFMARFAQLKDWSDDLPEKLIETSLRDSSVADLCSELWFSAFCLKANERRRRSLFTAPVDPKFLSAFRDFEERYEHILSHLEFCKFFSRDPTVEMLRKIDRQREWDYADSEASNQAVAVLSAIEFAASNIADNYRWAEADDNFVSEIEEGIAAWKRLCQDSSFDLRGVFRRRALIPFVLVPRGVAAKHRSAEKLSLLTNLSQAQEAFIFGTPYAALALMRSVMESVLRDHIHAEGTDLSERIGDARKRGLLPRRTNVDALNRLRKLSNAILHMDSEADVGLQGMTDAKLEMEILSLLYVLRGLIEGVR